MTSRLLRPVGHYLLVALATGVLTILSPSAEAQDSRAARLEINEQPPYGRYLTDRQGRSLYLFEQDAPGDPSTCLDACANAWPPFTTQKAPQAGDGVDEQKLGTLERENGNTQVTYGGWPLYYFNGDKQPGDALGQDVEHLGAEWYLVSPQGDKIEKGERSAVPDLQQHPSEGYDPASQGQEIHEKIKDNPGQADDS